MCHPTFGQALVLLRLEVGGKNHSTCRKLDSSFRERLALSSHSAGKARSSKTLDGEDRRETWEAREADGRQKLYLLKALEITRQLGFIMNAATISSPSAKNRVAPCRFPPPLEYPPAHHPSPCRRCRNISPSRNGHEFFRHQSCLWTIGQPIEHCSSVSNSETGTRNSSSRSRGRAKSSCR